MTLDPVVVPRSRSASPYAPTVNNTDKLFVYYLTRNCAGLENLTGGKCRSITNDVLPP